MPIDNDNTVAVAFGDFDDDGDLDLAVGNANAQNRLYLNEGPGRFIDVTAVRLPISNHSSDLALGDIDGDRDLDLVRGSDGVLSFGQERLYLNLLRQLDTPWPPRRGHTYELDVYARYGAAANGDLAFPLLAAAPAKTPCLRSAPSSSIHPPWWR